MILSISGVSFSLSNIPYYFMDGQEITLNGKFVECVPNRILAVCQPGFQANDGKYFLVTNMQEMIEQNSEVRQPSDESEVNTERQYQLTGIFAYGLEEKSGFEAAGRIEVTSVTLL